MYKCKFPKCGKTFNWNSAFLQHKTFHSGLKPFRCKICPFRSATKGNCKKHEATHEQNRERVQCDRCHLIFLTKAGLHRHFLIAHLNIQPKTQFECIFCGKKYLGKGDFEKHLRTHIQEKPHFCGHCPSEFSQKSNLFRHIVALHPKNAMSKIAKFRCELCSKEFLQRSSLQSHIQRHLGETLHPCSECPKAFITKQELRLHSNMKHRERKRLNCKVCGKSYLDTRAFLEHQRAHDPEWRRYKCRGCHQQFKLKEDLNTHINSEHSELFLDRSCVFCQKIFAIPFLLMEHIRIQHIKEKPHFRNLCNKEFATRRGLHRHKNHHNTNRKQFHSLEFEHTYEDTWITTQTPK